MIGITSYLPNDSIIREKRLAIHREQLDWFKQALPDQKIIGCYQNYGYTPVPNESSDNLIFDSGIGMCEARNKLLEKFYGSDDDVLILCDDDVWFYDYYDSRNFLKDIEKFNDWGLIQILSPMHSPFKEANYKNIEVIQDNWILEPGTTILGVGLYILSNLKKRYCKEYYFDSSIKSWELSGYEDVDFFLQLYRDRIPIYKCNQLIEKSKEGGSTLFHTEDFRLENHKINIAATCSRYEKIGVGLDGSLTNVDKAAKHPILVKRDIPYVIEDRIKPKEKSTGMKSLF